MKRLKFILIFVGILFLFVLGFVLVNRLDPSLLTKLSFYIDLANPAVKVVRVEEGLRKEQVADVVGDKLGWDEKKRKDFLKIHLVLNRVDMEGRYFPKTYLINIEEEPTEVSATMIDEFLIQMEKIEQSDARIDIDQDTAIKIASLIQREAAGKSDMRLISGIIWNRINKDMKLQIDATLQYAKGSEESGWWQRVKPEDKKIQSSYNTYLNKGLPSGAIANPGIDSIYAAYHPQKTSCMFYLHDRNRKIHCSKTYDEHKRNIEIYY